MDRNRRFRIARGPVGAGCRLPGTSGEYEARMEHVLAKYIDFAAWLQVTCDEFNRRIGLDCDLRGSTRHELPGNGWPARALARRDRSCPGWGLSRCGTGHRPCFCSCFKTAPVRDLRTPENVACRQRSPWARVVENASTSFELSMVIQMRYKIMIWRTAALWGTIY